MVSGLGLSPRPAGRPGHASHLPITCSHQPPSHFLPLGRPPAPGPASSAHLLSLSPSAWQPNTLDAVPGPWAAGLLPHAPTGTLSRPLTGPSPWVPASALTASLPAHVASLASLPPWALPSTSHSPASLSSPNGPHPAHGLPGSQAMQIPCLLHGHTQANGQHHKTGWTSFTVIPIFQPQTATLQWLTAWCLQQACHPLPDNVTLPLNRVPQAMGWCSAGGLPDTGAPREPPCLPSPRPLPASARRASLPLPRTACLPGPSRDNPALVL